MKDYISGLINGYNDLIGTSKIVPLAALLIIAFILIYNDDSENLRRRSYPAVFLLSVYSGISYAVVLLYRKSKNVLTLLFSAVIICMAGEFVFYEKALKKSIYLNGETYEIIFSVVAIIVYFLIYGLIACRLFNEESGSYYKINRLIFMFSMILLSVFGFYSEKLALSTLLLSPLSLSSIILHGILPFLLWLYLIYEDKICEIFNKYFSEDTSNREYDLETDEYEEEWDMKKHKILNMRNMAIAVLVIVICFAGAVLVLNNKINTLYDATVLLNEAASEKASIYEVKSKDEITATVIVSSDGSVTVIGGRDESCGDALLEEIGKHSQTVSKWYLYGEDDNNIGAYNYCINNGLTVLNTYVLSGVEQIDK